MKPKTERKVNCNALLKTLPEQRQQEVAEWCKKQNDVDTETGRMIPGTGGLAYAQAQLAAQGCKVSVHTIGEFYRWWRERQRPPKLREEFFAYRDEVQRRKEQNPKP